VPDAAELVRALSLAKGCVAPRRVRQPTGSQRVRLGTDVIAWARSEVQQTYPSLPTAKSAINRRESSPPGATSCSRKTPSCGTANGCRGSRRRCWGSVNKTGTRVGMDRGCPLCVHAALADCRGGGGPRACGWLTAKRPSRFRRRGNDIDTRTKCAPERGLRGARENRHGASTGKGRGCLGAALPLQQCAQLEPDRKVAESGFHNQRKRTPAYLAYVAGASCS
jgi:hypothetical protein